MNSTSTRENYCFCILILLEGL